MYNHTRLFSETQIICVFTICNPRLITLSAMSIIGKLKRSSEEIIWRRHFGKQILFNSRWFPICWCTDVRSRTADPNLTQHSIVCRLMLKTTVYASRYHPFSSSPILDYIFGAIFFALLQTSRAKCVKNIWVSGHILLLRWRCAKRQKPRCF